MLELMSAVETEGNRGVTYEDGGGVYASEDGERTSADDIVVI